MKYSCILIGATIFSFALLMTGCDNSYALPQNDSTVVPHASLIVFRDWWKDENPKQRAAPAWSKAEVHQLTFQEFKGELTGLMKGMEYLDVTLFGSLQSFDESGSCWLVTVPVDGNFTGYEARAIVGCIDVKNNRILAVYILPK